MHIPERWAKNPVLNVLEKLFKDKPPSCKDYICHYAKVGKILWWAFPAGVGRDGPLGMANSKSSGVWIRVRPSSPHWKSPVFGDGGSLKVRSGLFPIRCVWSPKLCWIIIHNCVARTEPSCSFWPLSAVFLLLFLLRVSLLKTHWKKKDTLTSFLPLSCLSIHWHSHTFPHLFPFNQSVPTYSEMYIF